MMYVILIVLLLSSGVAIAQDAVFPETAAVSKNEQAITPADNSFVKLNALYARPNMMANPGLSFERQQADRSEPGVIDIWRERIFSALRTFSGTRQSDLMSDGRLLNVHELAEKENERREIARTMLTETLGFAQDRMPEIDKLVKALRFEISSGPREKAEAGLNNEKAGDTAASNTVAKNTGVQDKLLLKTGFRVRVESGTLGVVSETEVRYRKVQYFYKVNLDNQNDNSLGFRYVFSRNISMQVARSFSGVLDPIARDKPTLNLAQLICKF